MMQLDIYEWISIILDIFGAYIIYKFMKVFFDTRKSSRRFEFLTYAIYYILGTIMFIYVNVPVVLMFFNLAAFFALTYNYDSTLKKRLLSAILIYLILVCVEIFVGLVTGYFNFSIFSINKYTSIYGMIACRILSYTVVLLMNNFKNIKKGESVPTSNWICIVMIPAASLYVILILFQAQGLSIGEVLICIILIFFINFATFHLYDVITAALSDKMKNLLVLEQNKYYDRQFELIKTSLQTTNAIRHDLKNHMFSIRTLVENSEAEESLKYISKIMDDIGTQKDYSTSGNTVIDSIINFKFQEAVQNGIETALDLKIPERLEIPSFDMTIILGNLLDNAIQAASEVKEDRYINMKIKFDKGRLLIQEENPYSGVIHEKDGKLLTSNQDKENHGIGLETVKKVIQKYDGIMSIDYSEKIFSISLLLYVD